MVRGELPFFCGCTIVAAREGSQPMSHEASMARRCGFAGWYRPDDVYALFYGFLPGQSQQSAGARSPDQAAADAIAQQQPIGNPHQKIVLFADVRHLAAFATVQFGPADADDAQLTSWAEAVAQELIAAAGDNCQRYVPQMSCDSVAG